jgi:hypothetical protein
VPIGVIDLGPGRLEKMEETWYSRGFRKISKSKGKLYGEVFIEKPAALLRTFHLEIILLFFHHFKHLVLYIDDVYAVLRALVNSIAFVPTTL